jgi:hypothetical protein
MRAIDTVIGSIPIVGGVLGGKSGTVISIPVKVTGTLRDPQVMTFSPSAVGSGLIGVLKRTISLPGKVLQPVLPKGKN